MKKVFLLAGAVLLLFFALTGVVLAATSQDIYDDYADNGKLDGTYTQQELQAYLNDAAIHQYGEPTIVDPLDQVVKGMLDTTEFPFTGAQLAVIAIIAVALIAAGVVLRRMTRKRA